MKTKYEQDFHAWAFEQARRVRAGEAVDVEHVAEELESLGNQQRRELEARLALLMAHMLKCEFQPERHTRSWDLTIAEQRRAIARLINKMPSLKSALEEAAADAYGDAVFQAARETDKIEADFPARCPWTIEEVLEGK
jgi:hypothetical protein